MTDSRPSYPTPKLYYNPSAAARAPETKSPASARRFVPPHASPHPSLPPRATAHEKQPKYSDKQATSTNMEGNYSDSEEYESVGIPMDDVPTSEPYEDIEDPQFAMSFEYDSTFRAHKAAAVSEKFENILKKVYNHTLYGAYNCVVFTTGLFLVIVWGIINAFTIYSQSWCLSPILRFNLVCLQGVCLPLYEILKSLMKGIKELCLVLDCGCCRKRKQHKKQPIYSL